MSDLVRKVCDACLGEIDPSHHYIAAGVYGVDFHPRCWTKVGGPIVAALLGLGEIFYHQRGGTYLEYGGSASRSDVDDLRQCLLDQTSIPAYGPSGAQ